MARFIKGHKQAKGGKRPGAGRPTKAELAEKEASLKIWEDRLKGKTKQIIDHYLAEALKDNKVLIDAMKKLVPRRQTGDRDPGQTHGHHQHS